MFELPIIQIKHFRLLYSQTEIHHNILISFIIQLAAYILKMYTFLKIYRYTNMHLEAYH